MSIDQATDAHFPSDRAPRAMAAMGARGEHLDPIPAPVLALRSKRRDLMRRIVSRRRSRCGYLDLEFQLRALTTKQLKLENKLDRETKRKMS